MTLAITVNDADYSSNSIGWEAPTSVQPDCALFARASGLANLAQDGLQPTPILGVAPATAGVLGKSLPFVTLGTNADYETYYRLPQQMTAVSLMRVSNGIANMIQTGGGDGAAVLLVQRNATDNNYLACSNNDTLTANVDETIFDTWQIRTWQINMSKQANFNYRNYTTGLTSSASAAFSEDYTSTSTLRLGYAPPSSNVIAPHDVAAHMFWSSILGADDLNTIVSWLRTFAQRYGTTA
ncbi:hypothetical protein KBX73_09980 [Acetobacter persici]|uniref:hypothetical protein n=1 Tax=Acetobacter persici TaxID=1076596 RepID=UPI0020CF1264|nr:hypothetical protein [Acetobacter persici]MCP9320092.1 hypothetical protein [Acetobacter persici]